MLERETIIIWSNMEFPGNLQKSNNAVMSQPPRSPEYLTAKLSEIVEAFLKVCPGFLKAG
jgi:hypothetical protein